MIAATFLLFLFAVWPVKTEGDFLNDLFKGARSALAWDLVVRQENLDAAIRASELQHQAHEKLGNAIDNGGWDYGAAMQVGIE